MSVVCSKPGRKEEEQVLDAGNQANKKRTEKLQLGFSNTDNFE